MEYFYPTVQPRMGSIGLTEILVVLIIAFVLVQPKDLLHFARRLGKAYQQMKGMRDEFVRSLQDVQDEIQKAAGDFEGARGGPETRRKQE